MLHIYEFEIFKSESGLYLAFPFGLEGGTQGESFEEACKMAASWLKTEMEHRALNGLPFPQPTFENSPDNSGKIVVIAVDAGVDTIPRMTAAAAAQELGVSPGRVSQMVASGQLETFEYEGRVWVSKYSVDARKKEAPKAGRPKRP